MACQDQTFPNRTVIDTIDLQSTNAPSAKDHSRQPTHPAPLGDGPPAPHQAIALKQAEQDVEFHPRSPRMSQDLSNKELQLLHDDNESIDSTNATDSDHEPHNVQRNGGLNGDTGEGADGDEGSGDDGSEDDMMDKISSSPSIEDGGYHLPLIRGDSLNSLLSSTDTSPHLSIQDPFSVYPLHSSPSFLYPHEDPKLEVSEDHHQKGEYTEDCNGLINHSDGDPGKKITRATSVAHDEFVDDAILYDSDLDAETFHQLLIPADDPILDNSFDDAPLSPRLTCSSPLAMSQWDGGATGADDDSDDDSDDFSFSDDPRFVDSGWGGECLREVEDIDFDFVYALHTFVATVEGQANATKGDTMVLLDDTNSYWWLVRVVKDGSIGYLPAEHIETPTERLARLNKHRNIDLSQAMLGDNPEKTKNPLKKAMRRRNGKTVQFAPPTYVEPPDVEYSTEEEMDSDAEYNHHNDESTEVQDGDQDVERDEPTAVEPLQSRKPGNDFDSTDETRTSGDSQLMDNQRTAADSERASDEALERSDDATAAGRSRKGTVRNTDSFFKDDNMETRKINLTPSLLRDDSSGSTIKSTEGKEQYTRGSFDSLEKPQSPEKGKEDKKRKEKKGMLGGLFKRKDKKIKGHEDETEESKRSLEEASRESPQPKESMESLSQENQKSASQLSPQRQTSKLQKTPPAKLSTGVKSPGSRVEPVSSISTSLDQHNPIIPPPSRAPPPAGVDDARVASESHPGPGPERFDTASSHYKNVEAPSHDASYVEHPTTLRNGAFPSTKDAVQDTSSFDTKPGQSKAAQHRMALDDFDSSPEPEERPDALFKKAQPSPGVVNQDMKDRLSESPVEVTQSDPLRMQNPPALVVDTSSQEDPTISPSPASSAELIEASRGPNEREATPASTAQSSSNARPWNDANLRAYLEDEREIRDLLLLIKDKTDMKPPSRDHPLVKDLYKEENRKLGEMSKELDGLLEDFLARRARVQREKPQQGIS